MKKYFSVLIGFLAGILCGLLGVGGGVIVVIYLNSFLKKEQHIAQATAISVILSSAIISTAVYYYHGVLDDQLISRTIIGSMIGGFLGAKLMKKIPSLYLRRFFGLFMLFAGIRMLF